MASYLRLTVCCLLAAAVAGFVPPPSALPAQRAVALRQPAVCMTAKTKATRVNERRRAYNKQYKSMMKTAIKKVLVATKEGDYANSVPYLSSAMSVIDKNVKRGIIHKNTAARRKSRLTLKVKAIEPEPAAPAP